MTKITYYTISELIEKGSSGYDPLNLLTGDLLSIYKKATDYDDDSSTYRSTGFWLWSEATDDDGLSFDANGRILDMVNWLESRSNEIGKMVKIEDSRGAGTETVSKFVDTPETATDYSGDTHVTNVTKSTASAVMSSKEERDQVFDAIEYYARLFRKAFMMGRECL